MPFEKNVQDYIVEYCKKHLPDDIWLGNEFDFIKDEELCQLLGEHIILK